MSAQRRRPLRDAGAAAAAAKVDGLAALLARLELEHGQAQATPPEVTGVEIAALKRRDRGADEPTGKVDGLAAFLARLDLEHRRVRVAASEPDEARASAPEREPDDVGASAPEPVPVDVEASAPEPEPDDVGASAPEPEPDDVGASAPEPVPDEARASAPEPEPDEVEAWAPEPHHEPAAAREHAPRLVADAAARSQVDRPPAPARDGRNGAPVPRPSRWTGAHDTIEVSELFALLVRRVWLVVGTTAICVVLAGVLAMREIPRYRAAAVLRVGEAREALTQGVEAPTRVVDSDVNRLLSETQLLLSRSLIGSVVDATGFRLLPDYRRLGVGLLDSVRVEPEAAADTLWLNFREDAFDVRTSRRLELGSYGQPVSIEGVSFVLSEPPPGARATWLVASREAAIDGLLNSLSVSPRGETNIVDVSFEHPDPRGAQRVVNTLVLSYQAREVQVAQERARLRRAYLEDQLAETDATLAQAQRSLTAFRSQGQAFDTRQQVTAQQQNRLMLELRREELDADRGMFRSLLSGLDTTTATEQRRQVLSMLVSSPGIAENLTVSRIHDQVLRQRAVLDSLTMGAFGSAVTNPDVQRQRQLIESAEAELTSAIRSHVASLDARAAALGDMAARTEVELALLPPQMAEEARLAQIVQTYQEVGDQLREEYTRARLAEAVAVAQADIIDLAALPYLPLAGTRTIKVILGLLLGLALGSGLAFMLEFRNRSVLTAAEMERLFDLPVLAVIPRTRAPNLPELLSGGLAGGNQDKPRGSWLVFPNATASETVIEPRRATSVAAEAYRMLRTNYSFAQWTYDVRSLVVTSSAPGEGKTITAINLALSIAEEGKRVLLVDGDLWRGRIHRVFEMPRSPGLEDLLTGQPLRPGIVRDSGVPGLSVLTRGKRSQGGSKLTGKMALRAVYEKLCHQYDILIIDGPPVLAAGAAPVMPAVADGVLLLVRAGRTERAAIREALKELETVGARVLGTVLNDPDNVTGRGGRPYHYYQYARPASEDEDADTVLVVS